MDTTKKISVIMACYNCAPTLRKSIDSILAQTYTNWVMICCDDGSSDNTLEILNEYKEKYPDKFIVIKNDCNRYLPYSLNHCLEYVDTELVARMDADDWSLPKRFEIQVKYLEDHPDVDLISTGVSVSDGEKIIASIYKPEHPTKEDVIRANPFSHATIMTYKRVYDALGGYSLDPTVLRVEDTDLWFRFFAAGFVGHSIKDELYVVLEDVNAAKRRNLRARINSAKTRNRGYKLLGYKGLICLKPYLVILTAFVPTPIYRKIHERRLKNRTKQLKTI